MTSLQEHPVVLDIVSNDNYYFGKKNNNDDANDDDDDDNDDDNDDYYGDRVAGSLARIAGFLFKLTTINIIVTREKRWCCCNCNCNYCCYNYFTSELHCLHNSIVSVA